MNASASKILLISVDYPPHKDGVSAVSEALVKKLLADGHELCVIGPRGAGDKNYDARQPYKIFRSPGYASGYLRFFPLALITVLALISFRPRHVFAMNIAYGGVLAYGLRRLFGYSYYLWAYGYEFQKVARRPLVRRLYQKIYGSAERVFPITRFVASRLEQFGVARSKMQIIYPGVDTRFFRPPEGAQHAVNAKTGEKIILSVSRLVPRKGQDAVLRAMPDVLGREPMARYWIAGEGPWRAHLEALASKLGLQSHVRFLGKVQDERLRELYGLCDVFAMPSRECEATGHVEGFGIVFLEANACGKPVIAGISGGMPEAVEDGKSGLLVNPEQTQEVAAALLRLLQDAVFAKNMGEYGRRRVLERFDWTKTLQELRVP